MRNDFGNRPYSEDFHTEAMEVLKRNKVTMQDLTNH